MIETPSSTKEAKRARAYRDEHPDRVQATARKYYETHKEERLAYFRKHNAQTKDLRHQYYEQHKEEIREKQKVYMSFEINRQRALVRSKDWYWRNFEQERQRSKERYRTHINERKAYAEAYRLDLKVFVLKHYSPNLQCMCKGCRERNIAFLTLDHINGDGADHRREVGKGTQFYKWIIQNNFPIGFQVLCMNCNWGKRTKGACPVHSDPTKAKEIRRRCLKIDSRMGKKMRINHDKAYKGVVPIPDSQNTNEEETKMKTENKSVYVKITCVKCKTDKPLKDIWNQRFASTHGWGVCKDCREVQEQEALMDLVVG